MTANFVYTRVVEDNVWQLLVSKEAVVCGNANLMRETRNVCRVLAGKPDENCLGYEY
jgi:hypothetical protein